MTRNEAERLLNYLFQISYREERLSFQDEETEVDDVSVWKAASRLLGVLEKEANPVMELMDPDEYRTDTPVHRATELLLERVDGLREIFALGADGPQLFKGVDDALKDYVVEYLDEHWDPHVRRHMDYQRGVSNKT